MDEFILMAEYDNYNIYQFNNKYYLCIPKKSKKRYYLYLGFPKKDYSNISSEEISKELNTTFKLINDKVNNSIYLICADSLELINEAVSINDDTFYKRTFGNLCNMINKIFNSLPVDYIVRIIVQDDADQKIADWFELNFVDYAKGTPLNNFKESLFTDLLVDTGIDTKEEEKEEIHEEKVIPKVKQKKINNFGYSNILSLGIITSIFLFFMINIIIMLLK